MGSGASARPEVVRGSDQPLRSQQQSGDSNVKEFEELKEAIRKARGEGPKRHAPFGETELILPKGASNLSIFRDLAENIKGHGRVKSPENGEALGKHKRMSLLGPLPNLRTANRRNSLPDLDREGEMTEEVKSSSPISRRNRIYEKGFDVSNVKRQMKLGKSPTRLWNRHELGSAAEDEEAEKLITRAFLDFLGDDISNRISMVLNAMIAESIKSDEYLIRQGDEGKKMYVLQGGQLEVYIDGIFKRTLGPGSCVGELALLYNEPRSASVIAKSDCCLWSLSREKFREVQAMASSTSLVQRSTYLHKAPLLRKMDMMLLSKLAGSMTRMNLREGDTIVEEGEALQKCILIEKGEVEAVSTQAEGGCRWFTDCFLTRSSRSFADSGEHRVPLASRSRRGSDASTKETRRDSSISKADNGLRISTDLENEMAPRPLRTIARIASAVAKLSRSGTRVSRGTFLGSPVLLGLIGDVRGFPLAEEETVRRVCSPVTLVAKSDNIRCSYFTVEDFEAMIGPIDDFVSAEGKVYRSPSPKWNRTSSVKKFTFEKLSLDDLEEIGFLGRGSFGVVTLVRVKGDKDDNPLALKTLSKQDVLDGGQLAHVKDERKMLSMINHPLILHLYCTFQDDDNIYFLTETLVGGELWSILYENASNQGSNGLPWDHVMFYTANVTEALAYMHRKNIAYRDLKPENLMVDNSGYLRLIDLGFAKKIPFTVEVDGETQFQPRSFTMCGTPEYLAPEFIFNTGHDHSVDFWALGVLIYEMITTYTPFSGQSHNCDITDLFKRIAFSRKTGVKFPKDFDEKANGTECRDLITKLLKAEPSQRLGNLAGRDRDIKQHPYFESVSWESQKIFKKEEAAPWTPSSSSPASNQEDVRAETRRFAGSPEDFEEF